MQELSDFGIPDVAETAPLGSQPQVGGLLPSDGELEMWSVKGARRTVVRVGGVPEHFNYPIKLAQQKKLFEKHGVQVEWVVMKCGTGQMIEALKAGAVDMIIALTEGLVKDIAQGSDLRLLATYVESPLCWAVSAGQQAAVESLEDLKGGTFGISRYTSGSHLMAYTLAMQHSWDPQTDLAFQVEGNFKNLRNGVNCGTSDAFMWETFTTKPYHDSGELKRVGEIYTPWPAFMLAARRSTIDRDPESLRAVLAGIREAAAYFHRAIYLMPRTISTEFGLQPSDAEAWYKGVRISGSTTVARSAIEKATDVLTNVGVLEPGDYPAESFLALDAELDSPTPAVYNTPDYAAKPEVKVFTPSHPDRKPRPGRSPSVEELKENGTVWPLDLMFFYKGQKYQTKETLACGGQSFAHYR